MQKQQLDLIRQRGAEWCDGEVHSALVIMAGHQGEIVLQEAYGRLTDSPDSPAAQIDTIFPLASISKPIVATAMMKLVEMGLVGLNRPVSQYIPEFVGPDKELVTVHHLLTHTSGIEDLSLEEHLMKSAGVEDALAKLPISSRLQTYLEWGYDGPLMCPPGKRFYYSFYGYELLGEILRRVSQQPMEQFIAEQIFQPLGMHHSWFVLPDDKVEGIARRPISAPYGTHESYKYSWAPTLILYPGFESEHFRKIPWANMGAYSTVEDIFRFGQMILNGGTLDGKRVLSPASVSTMTRTNTAGIGSWFGEEMMLAESNYGYGWGVGGTNPYLFSPSLTSTGTIGHTGGGGTGLTIDRARNLVALYFSVELQNGPFDEHCWFNDLYVDMLIAGLD